MENWIEILSSAVDMSRIRYNEPMSAHTTFRIGGPADVWIEPDGIEELHRAVSICRRERIPYFLIGNGSNLLVADAGVRGVVISTRKGLERITTEGDRIAAEGGALLSRVAMEACRAGLSGMEFAAGIPGSVGGAVVMNAGAYGGDIRQYLTRARILTAAGELKWLPAEELKLGYRTSSLQQDGGIVVAAEFQFERGDADAIRGRIEELNRRRREKQPLEFPSAGSTFKRPEGYFAGKLIMDAGLAGFSVGGASVSEKHCGFVINRGDATAADVIGLCSLVRERVYGQFGVELEMEVRTLGL